MKPVWRNMRETLIINFGDGRAETLFCLLLYLRPWWTAELTLTLLGEQSVPSSTFPLASNLIWELLKWSCHSGLLGDLSPTLSLFILSACNPLERDVPATVASFSTGILNPNETPNRSIKAGARGSNPMQIWVKFAFYLFFFSPRPLF